MSSKKKIIVLLIALLGYVNLFASAWSFIAIDSLNLPNRISSLSLELNTFDMSLVKTPELSESLSTLKDSAIEELNSLTTYSEMLDLIPIYFLIIGSIFLIVALIAYFTFRNEKEHDMTK
jgi:hypothetical protein